MVRVHTDIVNYPLWDMQTKR